MFYQSDRMQVRPDRATLPVPACRATCVPVSEVGKSLRMCTWRCSGAWLAIYWETFVRDRQWGKTEWFESKMHP